MKLLFIHEVNWRRKVVYEIHDYPELLSLRGHEVVFIDFPEGETRRGFRRLLDLKTEAYPNQSRAYEGSSVEVRTPGRVFLHPLDRLFASITQVPAIWRALRDEQFDAVVLYGVPTNGWQTVRIAKHFGVPVLFRAIDLSHGLRRTPFGWLIKRAERSVLKRVDWVSANNEALCRYCIEHGVSLDRISVDYPGLDLKRFSPGPKSPELLQRYGIASSDLVVAFMGTFFRFAGLDWFLEGFAPTLRRRSEIRLLLVGGGEEEANLRLLVEQLGVAHSVLFTGVVSYESLAEHLRLADVAINPFLPGPVTHHALPGKVLQYVGCGVSTVSTPLDGLRGLFAHDAGVVFRDAGDHFVRSVEELLDDQPRRRALSSEGRSLLERRCRWDRSIDAFELAIEGAISPA